MSRPVFSHKDIDRYVSKFLADAVEGMEIAARQLLSDSRAVTPRRSGRLRRSGRVKTRGAFAVAELEARGRTAVTITYNLRYAGPQERGWIKRDGKLIRFRHYTTPGTGAHFLELTASRNKRKYIQIVKRHVRIKNNRQRI